MEAKGEEKESEGKVGDGDDSVLSSDGDVGDDDDVDDDATHDDAMFVQRLARYLDTANFQVELARRDFCTLFSALKTTRYIDTHV